MHRSRSPYCCRALTCAFVSDWAGEQTDETAVRDLTAEVTQLRAERDQLKRRTRDLLADVDELSAQLQEYGRGRALSVRHLPPAGSARSAVPQRLMDPFSVSHMDAACRQGWRRRPAALRACTVCLARTTRCGQHGGGVGWVWQPSARALEHAGGGEAGARRGPTQRSAGRAQRTPQARARDEYALPLGRPTSVSSAWPDGARCVAWARQATAPT